MRISTNFSLKEFSVSSSFPELVEEIPEELKPRIVALVLNVLQPICDETGWRCIITSGYRSKELNKAVKGSLSSQHQLAEASDCVFTDRGVRVPISTVVKRIKALDITYDQFIAYNTFVHLSFTERRANRKQFLDFRR